MSRVVLVSRDPWSALALGAGEGHASHVVLLDAAAAVARAGHPLAERVREALGAGTVVAVHDDAAARRGVVAGDLAAGIKSLDLDEIADLVADAPGQVMWL